MKVLFICTHNRCRSILSEAITAHVCGDHVEARSAGSQPVGEVHPLSLKYLQEKSISIEGLRSQSWDEFEDFAPDLVVTVCDSAANEPCPVWFGQTRVMHWGLSDPSKLEGSEAEKRDAFFETMRIIEKRAEALLDVVQQGLSGDDLDQALVAIGDVG